MQIKSTCLWLLPLFLLSSCTHEGRQKLEAAKAAKIEKYQAELIENQRLVAQSDSALTVLVPAINEAVTPFVYEKTEYDQIGRWYMAGTEPVNNIARSYLRMVCDEEGTLQLISTYAGSSDLGYVQVCVTAPDGTFCVTDTMPMTSDNNYHYQTSGTRYEVITYLSGTGVKTLEEAKERNNGSVKYDTDGGVSAFIAAHAAECTSAKSPMKVMLKGGKRDVSFSLSASELEKMVQTFQFAGLLQQRLLMQHQNKAASVKVQYLQERIASHQVQQ